MVYQLELKQEAKQDIIDDFLWYESKNEGLGARFVREAEIVIQYVAQYPLHFQIKYKNYREALLKDFPYLVIFEVFQQKVVVYSVFPARDNPAKKLK